MQNLLTTADGGLDSINSSLQRVRELSLQATNSIMSNSDRANIQREVDQLLGHIDQVAAGSQFNTRNLLDGSAQDLHTVANPDGSGLSVSIDGFSVASLGMSGFDVSSGSFDISRIDRAMAQVNDTRTTVGATTNRLGYNISNNQVAAENLAMANSRIADADMARESMDFSANRLLEQYRMFSMRSQMNMGANLVNLLL
jgi:flagellin